MSLAQAQFEPARRAALALEGSLEAAVGVILNAVETWRAGDSFSALAQLALLEETVDDADPSLQWAIQLWRARIAGAAGELERADQAAGEAMRHARSIDEQACALTWCAFAEIESQEGASQVALDRIEVVVGECAARRDERALAFALLVRAEILASEGETADSIATALEAAQADRSWIAPSLFLARQHLREGDVDGAERIVNGLDSEASELALHRSLIALVRERIVPLWAVSEYHDLRASQPSESVVGQLRALVTFCPQFTQARGTLGWKLLQIDRYDEAREQFEELAGDADADGAARASAHLGLAYLSSSASTVSAPQQDGYEDEDPVVSQFSDDTPAAITTPEARNAMTGQLSMLPLPDLLDFLRSSRRSGLLLLRRNDNAGFVCLKDGDLVGAVSPHARHLAQVLRDRGLISSERCLSLTRAGKGPMGWCEMPRDIVDDEQLRTAAATHVRSALSELLTWPDGMFAFRSRQECPELLVTLDTQRELLDLLRSLDEQRRGSDSPR
ncbi:MAG: DUF4388 domain-containing protein [Myxococcales bacterium]|nr:DUF4388 domain-containing protein [Myxococcales bacterium]